MTLEDKVIFWRFGVFIKNLVRCLAVSEKVGIFAGKMMSYEND